MPKVKTSQSRVCIVCGGKQFASYGDDLVKCRKCGLIVAKHIPTFDELSKLYQQDYFFGMEYSDYRVDRPALEKNFNIRIKHLKSYIHKNSKVIEVGCAYGYFLNIIKENVLWHKGYDVAKEGIDYAVQELKVNATNKDFLFDNEVDKNSIDLICMWDVIEHLGEPDKFILRSAKLLKTNGVLCLTTGDIGALVPRKRRYKWRMIHPPTHIYYFDTSTISKLLVKYGFEVTSIRHKPIHRNTGSVFNQLIVNRKAKNKNALVLERSYKLAKVLRLDRINFPLNLYDVMEVTAVKK